MPPVLLQKKGVTYGDIGLSYEAAMGQGQHWRILTATMAHVSPLHLLLNMSALWSLRVVEKLEDEHMGSVYYLEYTVVLIITSGLLMLAMYHVLIFSFRLEYYKRVTAIGYSAVIFGWMTILAVKQPVGKLHIFGMIPLPVHLAPFESLIITSLIVPQASFIGHLAGILAGYLIAYNVIQGMNLYWTTTLSLWLLMGSILSLKQSGNLELSFIQIEPVADAGMVPERVMSPTRIPPPPPPPPSGDNAV